MDEEVVETFIRDLSRGYGYRFPSLCYRCGRTFGRDLIDQIERYVRMGHTLIETVSRVRYNPSSQTYSVPGDDTYSETDPLAITSRDLCCRISLISPFMFPTGTNISGETPKKIVGTAVGASDGLDLFDYMPEEEAPRLEIDSDHKEVRLFIEDGIKGFEPPITWSELDDLLY